MPPQLEANKKQHVENWEHASDSYLALIVSFVSKFWLNTYVLKRQKKTNEIKENC